MSSPCLTYGLQTNVPIIGTHAAPVTLTTAYTGNTKTIVTAGASVITLYIDYTAQTTGNSIEIQVKGSPQFPVVGVTPSSYTFTNQVNALGVTTLTVQNYTFVSTGTSDGPIRIAIPIADAQLTISIKETVNAGTAGTAAVTALLGPT